MASVSHVSEKYQDFLAKIQTGRVRIPHFQRNFVWDMKASAKLLDSMIKGYPIGTFILWQTNEELRSIRSIGNLQLPEAQQTESVYYILDGQQRITSFFAAIMGEKIRRENGKTDDFGEIYVDLTASDENDIVTVDVSGKADKSYIRVTDLIRGKLSFLNSFPAQHHDALETYQGIIKGWSFNITYLTDASIDIATDVFTRLNVGGKTLTLFEVMVAKTYRAPSASIGVNSQQSSFDLLEKYEHLLANLRPVKYDTIAPATVLQVISMLIVKGCTRKQILSLDKQAFIATWDKTATAIKSAVEFFRAYGIPVSELLPYNALIVPFSYFFHHHPHQPSGLMLRRLEDFFWRCSLGTRYSSAVESKLAQDVERIDKILAGEQPYYPWSIGVSSEGLIKNGWFGTGRSMVKALLSLYAMKGPLSFNNNLKVNIDNSWLKASTSKNYHHFFPVAFMKRKYPTLDYWRYNHILNITIVDDFLNKRIIRDKAPAVYINEIGGNNERLSEALQTHYIGDLEEFGITTNDYDAFLHARANWISEALNNRIIPQDAGSEVQMEVEEVNEELQME